MYLYRLFEQVLNEAKYAGQLGYHFCTDEQLIYNLSNDSIEFNDDTHDTIGNKGGIEKGKEGISITRYAVPGKNLLYGLSNHYKYTPFSKEFPFKKWRLTLDLEKLSENHHIEPINAIYKDYDDAESRAYWDSEEAWETYKDATPDTMAYHNLRGSRQAELRMEAEERVIGSIYDLHKYIVAIDYIPYIKGLEDIPCKNPFNPNVSYRPKANKYGPEIVYEYLEQYPYIKTNYDFKTYAQDAKDFYRSLQLKKVTEKDEKANNIISNLKDNETMSIDDFEDIINLMQYSNPNLENTETRIINLNIDLSNSYMKDKFSISSLPLVKSYWGIKFNIKFLPYEITDTVRHGRVSFDFRGLPIRSLDFSNVILHGILVEFKVKHCPDLEEIKGLDFSDMQVTKALRDSIINDLKTLRKLKRREIKFPKDLKKYTFPRA